MKSPVVDVVIPMYRPGAWMRACIRSALDSRGVEVRVVVIDDLPGDPAVAAVRPVPGVELIVPERNLGFAAAVNRGVAAGRAEYVLLLNQDARLASDALALLCARMDADATLGSVGGKILHQAAPGIPPDGLIDSAGIEFRKGRRAVDIGQGDIDRGQFDGWRETFGVCAAVALYRRSALDRVSERSGVLDESFYMHKEDVDLAWRLRIAGYRSGVDGAALGFHARGTRRAADSHLGPAAISTIRAAIASERVKSRAIRRLAWRNQLRMLIKNESAAGLRRSMPWLVAHQVGYLALGLMLDPVGTLAERARFALQAPALLAERMRAEPRPDLPEWLP